MISLGIDVADLILQRTLSTNAFDLNTAIERLTTGSKINHAKDNAANYSISNNVSSKISSLQQIIQNTEDGILMLSTAEDGLNLMQNILERLRALVVQASNGTYGQNSREAIQAEVDEITEHLTQIRDSLEYNGITLCYVQTEEEMQNTAVSTMHHAPIREQNINNINEIDEIDENTSILSFAEDNTYVNDVSLDTDTLINNLDNTPKASLKSLRAPRLLGASPPITGAEDFSGNQTRLLTIDGISYSITNRLSSAQTVSYSKDTSSGQITFFANNFEIRAQVDVENNIIINGSYNYLYGGNLNDTLADTASSGSTNYIFGGAGDDTITVNTVSCSVRGGDGDDIITINSSAGAESTNIEGNGGHDTFNMYASYCQISGGDGNDVFNLYTGGRTNVMGNDGDDNFNVYSSSNIIDGGSGNNTTTGTASILANNTIANSTNSNSYIEYLTKDVAKDININGTMYNVVNNIQNTTFIYSIDNNGSVIFKPMHRQTIIRGEDNKAHNVTLNSDKIIFYGGNLADTIVSNSNYNVIYAGDGDNNIINNAACAEIFTGNGNDTITMLSGNRAYISSGSGDDNITLYGDGNLVNSGAGDDVITISRSTGYSGIYSSSGNATLINNSSVTNFYKGFGIYDNAEVVMADSGSVNINGLNYNIKASEQNANKPILYSYNNVTGVTSFVSYDLSMSAADNASYNVEMYGNKLNFTGGEQDDIIANYSLQSIHFGQGGNDTLIAYVGNSVSLYGGSGDDTFEINTTSEVLCYGQDGNDTFYVNKSNAQYHSIDGGNGNDIYYLNNALRNVIDSGGNNIYNINISNANISGANGNDTFYVNGNNNTVLGAGGNDYFYINGSNNTIDGGTGYNTYIDNSTGNTVINAVLDPNSGSLTFTSLNENKQLSINGKTYSITNNISGANTLCYSLNENTGILSLQGSNFKIEAEADQQANLEIRGNNNSIIGSTLSDTITIESGSNNSIEGNDGNDTIIMNSDNNTISGGAGNDTITLNAVTNKTVDGGEGNDTINVITNGNTNITGGIGNDSFNISGTNNRVTSGAGDNSINITGDDNTVTATNGNNRLMIDASNNVVTLGNGNNYIGVQGSNNTVTAGQALGNVDIIGDNNNITTVKGDVSVTIKGNGNTYDTILGKKNVTVIGNSNNLSTGDMNDNITIQGNSNTAESSGGNNTVNIIGNNNNYQGGADVDKVNVHGSENTILGGDSDDKFTVMSGGSYNIIDGQGGNRNTVIDKGTNTQITNAIEIKSEPREIAIKVDTGSGDDKFVNTTISFDLLGFTVDLSSVESAVASITAIDDIMKSINEQITNVGASINRLESALDSQSVKLQNLVSTHSTIRDADVAVESSKLIKYQILQQASVVLMSTSRNLKMENILGLLNRINN